MSTYLSQNKITVEDFAGVVGLSAPAIYKYLSGERTPRGQSVPKIAEATGGAVTANDFYNLPTHKVTIRSKKKRSN